MFRVAFTLSLLLAVGCKDGQDTDDPAVLDLDANDGNRPSKRSEVLAAAHDDTNQIMIFGGNDGPVVNQIPTAHFLGDTWVFEPGVGWTEVETDTQPRRRGRYTTVVDHANSRALLFGGRFRPDGESGDYRIFNDLWQFDFLTREWTKLDDGTGPAERYYPASGWDAETETLYIWGGNLNSNPLQFQAGRDLWMYRDGEWTEIETSGEEPSPRMFFGATFDTQRKRLVVFGGHRGDFQSLAYNETYALDVETGVWERLHAANRKAPSTRMHAHILYDDAEDRYLLFGGHTDVGDHNDLWEFDTSNNRWHELHIADVLNATGLGCGGNSTEVPADYVTQDVTAPERRHRGMYAMMHDNLWIAGGIHAECSDQVNDTWRYDLGEGQWHELIESTTGESCARRGDDCQCLCL